MASSERWGYSSDAPQVHATGTPNPDQSLRPQTSNPTGDGQEKYNHTPSGPPTYQTPSSVSSLSYQDAVNRYPAMPYPVTPSANSGYHATSPVPTSTSNFNQRFPAAPYPPTSDPGAPQKPQQHSYTDPIPQHMRWAPSPLQSVATNFANLSMNGHTQSPDTYVSPQSFHGLNERPTSIPQQSVTQRPPMPVHQYTEPYLAPSHPPEFQMPYHQVPQYIHTYQGAPVESGAASPLKPHPPPLPVRHTSAPLGNEAEWQSTYSNAATLVARPNSGQNLNPKDNHSKPYSANPPNQWNGPSQGMEAPVADPKSRTFNRFIGQMLPVRVGRAGLQSLTSTAKYNSYLSPWGDNNPVTLPNIRTRDVAFGAASHATFGALHPSSLSMVGKVLHSSVKLLTEHVAEEGFNKALGVKATHKIKRRVGITSLDVRIKHKLIGESAVLTLRNARPAFDKRDHHKGWFCPYLYASGRTPQLARAQDFDVVQLHSPGLAADAALAPAVLSTLSETETPILALCPWDPNHPLVPRFRRVAIILAGISPYRNTWSQSRIPNEARLSVHLFTHVPALVVPVGADAPVMAWNSWTLDQMTFRAQAEAAVNEDGRWKEAGAKVDMALAYGEMPHEESLKQREYDSHAHVAELESYLHSVLDVGLIGTECQEDWKGRLEVAIQRMVEAAGQAPELLGWDLGGHCKMERCGFVMFRY